MRVLIITEGSISVGFGHITRCTSLYQAFEEMGITPEFIVNGDETVEALLAGKKHRVFNWIKEEERLINLLEGANMVIIDSYLAGLGLYGKISEIAKTAIYIDDNKRVDYPKGIVLNGTIYAEEIGYPEKVETTYLLGVKYIPLRKEFWDAPERKINEVISSVMVTFGGDDYVDMTPRILKLLNSNYPGLIKKVIIGKAFTNAEDIRKLADDQTELIYYPDAAGMKKVMLESDVAISAGGQTLYELARTGTPTVAVAVDDNQLSNLKGWQRAGFVEFAGLWEDDGLGDSILGGLKSLEGIKTRTERSRVGQHFVDGRGSRRIVDLLLRGN